MSAGRVQDCVQFIAGGPWVPIDILHAIEEGSLVLFCGAGVSRRCGLPDFAGLVEKLSEVLGRSPDEDERKILKDEDYPSALGLLEARIDKKRVRSAIASILDIPAGQDLKTHEALLQLATARSGQPRLVTTNFDRAFELCAGPVNRRHAYAPYLPVPRDTWQSIVHLHGGCGDANDQSTTT